MRNRRFSLARLALAAAAMLVGCGRGPGPDTEITEPPASRSSAPAPEASVHVPDLDGVTEEQAREILRSKRLLMAAITVAAPAIPAGRVAAQSPAAGDAVAPGACVRVSLSVGRGAPAAARPRGTAETIEPNGAAELATMEPKLGAPVVCIDPGHPSETSAGASDGGLSETHLNWAVAVKLQAQLGEMGIRSILTKRRENEYLTNRQRAEIANQNRVALFLRLHCDDSGGAGYTWYYPDRAATRQGITGPPASVQRASREAADTLYTAMLPFLRGRLKSNPVRTDAATFVGSRQGGVLTGSIFARVPTVLLEMCFINRRSDARFIASEAGQDTMARALAAAVAQYLDRRSDAEF